LKSQLTTSASHPGIALNVVILIVVSVAIVAFVVNPSAEGTVTKTDPILESFERDMTREPTPAAPVSRDSIDEDELYETINTIQWTTDKPVNADDSETARSN
jgi:hypothetical protein